MGISEPGIVAVVLAMAAATKLFALSRIVVGRSGSVGSRCTIVFMLLGVGLQMNANAADSPRYHFCIPDSCSDFNTLKEAEDALNARERSLGALQSGETMDLFRTYSGTYAGLPALVRHYRKLFFTGTLYDGSEPSGSFANCNSWPAPSYHDEPSEPGNPGAFAKSWLTSPAPGYAARNDCAFFGLPRFARSSVIDYEAGIQVSAANFDIFVLVIYDSAPPDKNLGACGTMSNPCNPANGNKYQAEEDYRSGDGGLAVQRHYNSLRNQPASLGFGWNSSFQKHLEISGSNVLARQASGRGEPFDCRTIPCRGDADSHLALVNDAAGYSLKLRSGASERYDTTGRLMSETDRSGRTTNYLYGANGALQTVTGPFGHVISHAYDAAGKMTAFVDPSGQKVAYAYDGKNNLTRVDYPDGSAKLYHYEDANFPLHLTGISYVDGNGVSARYGTYRYDASGRAIVSEHAGGVQHYSFTYNSDTQTIATDAVNTSEVMTFQTNLGFKALVSKVNQSDGKFLSQVFDASNNLVCKQDEEGRVATYTYNATNQKLSMTEGQSGSCSAPIPTAVTRTTTYGYLSSTLDLPTLIGSPSVLAGQSKTTTIAYGDSAHPNLPTSIAQSGFSPAGESVSRTVTLGYNAAGQVNRIDGPRTDVNDVSTLAYNECTSGGGCGQLASITNALGQTTTFDSYDANGRLLQMTDANGLRTSYNYDPRGRVLSLTQTPPNGANRVTSYTYTAAGDVASVTFPDGRTLSYSYDAARLLRQVTDNLGNQIRYGYDLKGNRTQEQSVDPGNTLLRQIDYVYDARNHLASINTAGSLTQQISDALGNLTQTTDPNSNPPTRNNYDSLNRLIQTVNALGGANSYGYNVQDRLAQVSAPNGAATQYQYDDLGNLLQEVSADRGATTYTYDAAGNLTSQTDARGVTAAYTYDALNRLTSIHYGTGGLSGFLSGLFSGSPEDVTYIYDQGATTPSNTPCSFGIGRLCQVQDASGVTQYAYDAFGNIAIDAHTEQSITYTTRYTYDAADRILSLSYPDGRIVAYTRDALGRILSVNATVNNADQTIVSTRSYRPDGLLLTQNFGNGVNEVRQYDLQGRLTSEFIGSADTRLYNYDANGNLTQEQAVAQVGNYSYDALDRLTRETLTTTATDTNAFTYDANGNRLSDLKNNGVTRAYSYQANSNRLTQLGSQTIALDAAGNTVNDRNGNRAFAYTNAGRLAQVTIAGVLKGSYLYNAQGQRTEKTKITNTGATQSFVYHYDTQGHLISESRPNGNRLRAYVWADDQPLAQIQWNAATQQEVLVYLHSDHVHSPRLATDSAQTVVWRWESEAFGTGKPDTDPDADDTKTNVRLRLPGQYADGESGLYYNWNRYYDPKTGRYITSDPIGINGGFNTYAYVNDNPLYGIDLTGLIVGGGRSWPGGGSNNPSTGDDDYTRNPGIPRGMPGLDRGLRCMVRCLGYPIHVTSTHEETPYHSPGDVHMTGRAADIRYPGWPGPNWNSVAAQGILCCAGKCSFGFAQDEYNHPSAPGVPPHIHVQIPGGTKSGGRGDIPPGCTPSGCPPK